MASTRLALDTPEASLVTLPLPDGTTFRAHANVDQRTVGGWDGFAAIEDTFHEPPLHTFEVAISSDLLAIDEGQEPEAFAATWDAIGSMLRLSHAPDLFTPESAVLARLEVSEIAAHIAEQAGGWWEVMDYLGDTMRAAWPLVEGLQEDIEPTLLSGSLLWFRKLGVHPAVRGQALGAKLMAHALWALSRAPGDLAILDAAPIASWFDARTPRQTVRGVRALRGYYSRVGFTTYREKGVRREPSLMYLRFGEFGIPVDGLGEMTRPG